MERRGGREREMVHRGWVGHGAGVSLTSPEEEAPALPAMPRSVRRCTTTRSIFASSWYSGSGSACFVVTRGKGSVGDG